MNLPIIVEIPDRLRMPLTDHQKSILRAAMNGYSDKEIARMFTISEHTVKNHFTRIYSQLAVRCRVEAIVTAIALGIIELPPLKAGA